MSLFGDLPTAKNDADGGAQAASFKRTLLPPPSILRSKKSRADAQDVQSVSKGRASGDTIGASHGLFSAFGTIEDEYDPAVPNEYMKAKEDQEKAVLEAEMEARKAAEEREAVRANPYQNRREVAKSHRRRSDAVRLVFEAVRQALQARAAEGPAGDPSASQTGGLGSSSAPGSNAGASGGGSAGGQMSKAMRMMQSMGWSEGRGLGKEGQGMATPIILQKTDKRSGVIVNAEPLNKPAPQQGVQLSGPPSRVVLLRNMVSPGDVDEGLEDEVAEEVSKFGDVLRVLIFEVDGNAVAPEQAVRIFVELDKVEAATKAIVGLHGRYFDQKTISATFFDEQRFEAMDLAPRPEELQ